MMNPECAKGCPAYEKGCQVGLPVNIQGELTTGRFCDKYTCTTGRQTAKNAWRDLIDHPDGEDVIQADVVGGTRRKLHYFHTRWKPTFNRAVDDDGNIFARGGDDRWYTTGINCFLTNDIP